MVREVISSKRGRSLIWTVRILHQEELVLRVTDVLLDMLLSRVRDSVVKQLDPYRDSMLDSCILLRWRDELARVKQVIRRELEGRLTLERSLPRKILRSWVDRELAADEHFQMLLDVEASVSLALEGGGVIDAFGD